MDNQRALTNEWSQRPSEESLCAYVCDFEFALYPDRRLDFHRLAQILVKCVPAANRKRLSAGKSALAIVLKGRTATIRRVIEIMDNDPEKLNYKVNLQGEIGSEEIPLYVYLRPVQEESEEEILARHNRLVGKGALTVQELERDLQAFI